jgi:hypothetical protein
LNQLLCAATVNSRFRDVLLRDPARALSTGYYGQSFALTSEEEALVLGIRAHRLEDFAAQVFEWLSASTHSHDGSGRGTTRKVQDHAHQLVEPYRVPTLARV